MCRSVDEVITITIDIMMVIIMLTLEKLRPAFVVGCRCQLLSDGTWDFGLMDFRFMGLEI